MVVTGTFPKPNPPVGITLFGPTRTNGVRLIGPGGGALTVLLPMRDQCSPWDKVATGTFELNQSVGAKGPEGVMLIGHGEPALTALLLMRDPNRR